MYGFTEEDTTIDNIEFKRIRIPEELIDYDTAHIGKPQIPYIRLLVAVPDSCEFTLDMQVSEPISYTDYTLYPVPTIVFEEDSFGCFGSEEQDKEVSRQNL